MNTEELIISISKIAEEDCKKESNIFGYEIWTYHIVSVVKYANLMAVALGADQEIVTIAALLHDFASIKDASLYEDHHIHGAAEAERILTTFDYPKEKIQQVKDCIVQHRGSVLLKQTTKESICVASADAMAHIDQVPSLLHLAYSKKKMPVNEGSEWVSGKIERSWNKLCPEAKALIKDKYESAKVILQ